MSTDNVNDDLKLMGEYDFKTPLNATVIFCDDEDKEDDSTPIVEKKHNNNEVNNNLNKIVSSIIQDITRIAEQGSQGRSSNISTTSADNHKSIEISDNVRKDSTSFQTKASRKQRTGQTLTKDIQSTNNNQIATNSQTSNSHPLVCLQQLAHPSNQDDISQTVNKCVQALLDTVSVHLVFIMQAFEEYNHIRLKTSDAGALQKASKRYTDIKLRFFYLSFSTVSNIMIPKENNSVFFDNFIDNTIKLAKTRQIHCKRTDTSLLCNEMFRWVRSRMKSPVLAELLQNDTEYRYNEVDKHTNSFQEQQNCSANCVDNTCLFRSGPAGKELTIRVSQGIVNNSQSTTQQCNQSYKMPSTQNILPSPALSNDTAYNTQEYKSYGSYKQTTSHPHKSTPRLYRNQAERKQVQHETYHHYHYNHQTPAPQTRQSPPYYLPQINPQSVPSTVINTQNYTETPLTNQAIYHGYQREEHLEVNRSLSRDSGFMSPSTSASNEPTCSPRFQFDQSSSSTPLITHVTSLNPSVAFIRDGACYVCGKVTKQKCLRCYSCYYCSYQCQIADWKYHHSICKNM